MATPAERIFLEKFITYFNRMQVYEDEVAQTLALSILPTDEIIAKSTHSDKLNQIELITNLLKWFKEEFFSWVDTPTCQSCNTLTGRHSGIMQGGAPTEEEKLFGANRVEIYVCDKCSKEVRFPRYNDPIKLLETRKGRCGEWANCFTLFCRALHFETRSVFDESDHVWCEVWINDLDRWVHCDPCENVLDNPLLYEKGWGKELSYVLAFAVDHIRDVTWRYTFDHSKVLKRRNLCREHILMDFVNKLNATHERIMSDERKQEQQRRFLKEIIEFLSPKMQLRECSEAAYQGRTTGSLEWREMRNELGKITPATPTVLTLNDHELAAKYFRLEYYCAKDQYKRGDEVINGWESLINTQKYVFRKKETDWKKVYLCRIKGYDTGEMSWLFNLTGLNVKSFTVQLNGIAKYDNGKVTAMVCCGDECNMIPTSGLLTIVNKRSNHFILKVIFSGGSGDVAWQQAQLFRCELSSEEPNLVVTVELE